VGRTSSSAAIAAGEKIATVAWRNSPYAGEAKQNDARRARAREGPQVLRAVRRRATDALLVTTAKAWRSSKVRST